MSQNVVISTTLDDTSSNVTYAGTGWTYHTNQQSIYHLYNASDTFSGDQGATATLNFYGTAIDYWGNQGPYHGPCKITLDGTDVATVNSNAAVDDDPILLYSNNNLQLGDHTLVITVVAPAYPNVCEVDRFVVNVTSSVTYTSVYAYTGPGSTPTGGSVPTGSVANNGYGGNGNGNGHNNTNGNTNKSSSPPVAAIAGAVGGVAAIAILLLVWWWYRRSKRNRPNTMAALKKRNTEQIKPFLADGAMLSPSTLEKSAFDSENGTRPVYPNQPSSYVSSSPPPSTYPPSSPPPSTVGYNNYPFGPASTVPPTSVGHPSPPGSPQPNMRPMSTISAAPTTSYYSSAPMTIEGGGYPVPSQPVPTSTIAPVWATPAPGSTAGYQPVPTEPSPSPSPAPVPVAAPIVATDAGPVIAATGAYDESRRPEKARYTGSQAPPEKARFTGTSSAGQSGGGASSSAAPTVDTTAPAANASGQPGRRDTMSPVVPEAPPPAYQI